MVVVITSDSTNVGIFEFHIAMHGMWMCGCVDVWMCGRVDVWTCGRVDVWTCACACACVCVCVCMHIPIYLTFYTPFVVLCYTEIGFFIDVSERGSTAIVPGLERVPVNIPTSFVVSSAANTTADTPVTITCKWTI